MNLKRRFIEALLRSYPAEWRREYGAELVDLLATQMLGVRVVADVLWSGFQQRMRSLEPAMLLGFAAMLASLGLLVANVVAPQPYGGWTTVLEPSSMTFPTVRVSAVVGEVFSVLFFCCGCWTYRRRRGTPSQAGWAAATLCLFAGIPVVVAGALLLLGVLDLAVVGPGESAASIQNGLAFTYYSADGHFPSPLSVILFPLSRVPIAWLWGTFGGHVARWTARVDIPGAVGP
jgi:hypothetical protein